jgi:hypothetical protein
VRRRTFFSRAAIVAAAVAVAAAVGVVLATRGGSPTQGLSHDKVARLHKGMSKREVRNLLGKPDQSTFIPYPTAGEVDEGFEECWNYGIKTLPKTPLYQLCFWNGRLTSQARYG